VLGLRFLNWIAGTHPGFFWGSGGLEPLDKVFWWCEISVVDRHVILSVVTTLL
jgi:hypothetical protein